MLLQASHSHPLGASGAVSCHLERALGQQQPAHAAAIHGCCPQIVQLGPCSAFAAYFWPAHQDGQLTLYDTQQFELLAPIMVQKMLSCSI